MAEVRICPCGSTLLYAQCCGRFHKGAQPENALVLMRSRYSAYAMQEIDYVMKTTHAESPHKNSDSKKWKQELLQFARGTKFLALTIVEFVDGSDTATVTFTAKLMQGGSDASFTEKSTFYKVNERWLYHSGSVPARSIFEFEL